MVPVGTNAPGSLPSEQGETITVFAATGSIARGMSGSQAVAEDLIGPTEIPAQYAPSSRLLTLDEISDLVAIFNIAPDTVIVVGMFAEQPSP